MKRKVIKPEPKKVCDCPLSELTDLHSESLAEGHIGEKIYYCKKCGLFRYVHLSVFSPK
jgi:hypothetical protein